MEELASPKTLVAQRARKRRRPRSDDLLNVYSRALKLAHNFQQAIIAGVRRLGPFSLRHTTVLAVIVVQPAELESCIGYSARQPDNFSGLALLDPGAIHARIYIEENSHPAAAPLTHLLVILGQNGNAHFRKLLSYFPRPARICARCRIREEHINRAATAGNQQFQCGRALEIADTPLHQHAQREAQLGGLDVDTPAIRIAAQQFQGLLDVRRDHIGIQHQRRGEHIFDAGNAIALVPIEFAQHILHSHHGLDDNASTRRLTTLTAKSSLAEPSCAREGPSGRSYRGKSYRSKS